MTTSDGNNIVAPKALILPPASSTGLNGQICVSGGFIYYLSGAAWYYCSGACVQPMG